MKPAYQPRAVLFGALLAIWAVPAAAQTYSASHGTQVNQLDASRFEVILRSSGGSGYGYWCGAARYVTGGLGQAWTTDITIARGRARSETANGRTTVIFTINPAALGIATSGIDQINSLSVGQTMNAQRAASFCHFGGAGGSR